MSARAPARPAHRRPANRPRDARLAHEYELRRAGFRRIAGIDEVGRGSLAGPVVAAAVILPARPRIKGLRDSKVLPRRRREALYEQIVLPLLKQRNPDARRRASQTVTELVRLGDEMRRVLLRRGLRDHIPPG